MEIPKEPIGVLAEISGQYDRGKSSWYEVVYYDGDEWCSYKGSDTFEDGEKVIRWIYIEDCFKEG